MINPFEFQGNQENGFECKLCKRVGTIEESILSCQCPKNKHFKTSNICKNCQENKFPKFKCDYCCRDLRKEQDPYLNFKHESSNGFNCKICGKEKFYRDYCMRCPCQEQDQSWGNVARLKSFDVCMQCYDKGDNRV